MSFSHIRSCMICLRLRIRFRSSQKGRWTAVPVEFVGVTCGFGTEGLGFLFTGDIGSSKASRVSSASMQHLQKMSTMKVAL